MTRWFGGMKLTDDRLNSIIMDWTPLSSLGTFQTNFQAGTPTPRMRKINDSGTEVWEFEGTIRTSNVAVATTYNAFIFNTGHRVAAERGFQVYGASSAYNSIRVGFISTGNLTIGVPTAAGTGTSTVWLDDVRITNPLG